MAEKKRAIALAGGGPAVGWGIGADTDCVGTNFDAVNSNDFLRLHADRDTGRRGSTEGGRQIRQRTNFHTAPHNLVMLFTATASDDDGKFFKNSITESKRDIWRIENPMDASISVDCAPKNLDCRVKRGGRATHCTTNGVLSAYRNTTGDVTVAKLQAVRNDAA